MHFENGDKFQGTFDDNEMIKSGSLLYDNRDEFKGEFENGFRKVGAMYFNSGNIYRGEFENGRFHGTGELEYVTGDLYSGDF